MCAAPRITEFRDWRIQLSRDEQTPQHEDGVYKVAHLVRKVTSGMNFEQSCRREVYLIYKMR